MSPQHELSEAIYQQTDHEYGRYAGEHPIAPRQSDATSYGQEEREEPASKVYPLPSDKTNVLRFTLVVIALGLLLLFGLIFVVLIGGDIGWASFAVACFALFAITGIGTISLRSRG